MGGFFGNVVSRIDTVALNHDPVSCYCTPFLQSVETLLDHTSLAPQDE